MKRLSIQQVKKFFNDHGYSVDDVICEYSPSTFAPVKITIKLMGAYPVIDEKISKDSETKEEQIIL